MTVKLFDWTPFHKVSIHVVSLHVSYFDSCVLLCLQAARTSWRRFLLSMRNWKQTSESYLQSTLTLLWLLQCCIFGFGSEVFHIILNTASLQCASVQNKQQACTTSKLDIIFCNIKWFYRCSELIEFARKSLISRVVEVTDDRTALKLEVSSLQETVSRLEGRIKEREEEAKRYGS